MEGRDLPQFVSIRLVSILAGAHRLTIVWAGDWFWSREYLKFSIHIFTVVNDKQYYK